MSSTIPFIRAAALAPIMRWLLENGRDPAPMLERADLDWIPLDDPLFVMPLRPGVRFLVEIARIEGPDAPCRIVNGRGGFEIGLIGAAAFSGSTLIDGLRRVVQAMPRHCTHEIFSLSEGVEGIRIRDGWAADLGDGEARHMVHQYVAALIQMICRTIAARDPCPLRISMTPHPTAGLDHLRQWFGDRLEAATGAHLDILIPSEAALCPISADIRAAALQELKDHPGEVLRPGRSLSEEVAALVTSMLPRTTPSLGRTATAAGVSARTLRRHLAQEGRNFTDLVEQSRARIALQRLHEDRSLSLAQISRGLGYANQATLSRAVQRWTGMTPREWRKTGTATPQNARSGVDRGLGD